MPRTTTYREVRCWIAIAHLRNAELQRRGAGLGRRSWGGAEVSNNVEQMRHERGICGSVIQFLGGEAPRQKR